MKKLLTVLLALCLLCSVAMAESVTTINWEDVFGPAVEAGQVEGEFVTFDEIAVKIWIPEGLQAAELSDEDREKGYIGYFTEESGATVAVMYVNTNGASLEEYADYLKTADGVKDAEMIVLNGLPAVSYDLPEQDATCIAFTTEAGYILEITMTPVSAEGAEFVWGAVGSSIQAAE